MHTACLLPAVSDSILPEVLSTRNNCHLQRHQLSMELFRTGHSLSICLKGAGRQLSNLYQVHTLLTRSKAHVFFSENNYFHLALGIGELCKFLQMNNPALFCIIYQRTNTILCHKVLQELNADLMLSYYLW